MVTLELVEPFVLELLVSVELESRDPLESLEVVPLELDPLESLELESVVFVPVVLDAVVLVPLFACCAALVDDVVPR